MGGENRRGPVAKEDVWQGKPTLVLAWRDDFQYPFSFGLAKAKLLMAAVDRGLIQAFIAKHKDDPRVPYQPRQDAQGEAPAGPRQAQGTRQATGYRQAEGGRQAEGYRQPTYDRTPGPEEGA